MKANELVASLKEADINELLIQYLTTVASGLNNFHKYSFANTMLIFHQCPNASLVAGFRTWQRMDRFVKKGEKAIWILAPMKFRVEDEAGEETFIRRFKSVPVFDYSQTDGQPLDALVNLTRSTEVHEILSFDSPLYTLAENYRGEALRLGYTFVTRPEKGSLAGSCNRQTKQITIYGEQAEANTANKLDTLIHESLHAIIGEIPSIEDGDEEIIVNIITTKLLARHGFDNTWQNLSYMTRFIRGRATKDTIAILQQADKLMSQLKHLDPVIIEESLAA